VLKPILLLLLLLFGACSAHALSPATNSPGRVLLLDNSTMPLSGAKATIIIGPLTRTNDLYVGNFKVKVFPYFFKSDWGRLAISVPTAALAEFNQGQTMTVTGTSTSLKNGAVRHIEITATPIDRNHGNVSLWFMVKDQKMIFTPAYHFTNSVTFTLPDKGSR
jgi:hypothetical protein